MPERCSEPSSAFGSLGVKFASDTTFSIIHVNGSCPPEGVAAAVTGSMKCGLLFISSETESPTSPPSVSLTLGDLIGTGPSSPSCRSGESSESFERLPERAPGLIAPGLRERLSKPPERAFTSNVLYLNMGTLSLPIDGDSGLLDEIGLPVSFGEEEAITGVREEAGE